MNRKKVFMFLGGLLLAVLVIVVFPGDDGDTSGNGVQKIEQEQAYKDLEENEEILLLDVRTRQEYEQEHIPGSVLIPLDELRDRSEAEIQDKSRKIYVYCRTGRRSADGVELLQDMGYQNVYDMGGIVTWPYETVKGQQE